MIRDIIGWDNYLVSDSGEVYSTKGTHPLVRKQRLDKDGYATICLSSGVRRKLCKVHRLVATAFIPNPLIRPTVNHKNGIRNDNKVSNLEWATWAENNQHAYTKLGKKPPRQGLFNRANPTVKPVIQMDMDGKFLLFFWSAVQAGRDIQMHSTHITRVCRGRRKSAHGFKWRYATPKEINQAKGN